MSTTELVSLPQLHRLQAYAVSGNIFFFNPFHEYRLPYPPGTAPSPYPTHSLSLSGSGGIRLSGALLTQMLCPHYSVLPTAHQSGDTTGLSMLSLPGPAGKAVPLAGIGECEFQKRFQHCLIDEVGLTLVPRLFEQTTRSMPNTCCDGSFCVPT